MTLAACALLRKAHMVCAGVRIGCSGVCAGCAQGVRGVCAGVRRLFEVFVLGGRRLCVFVRRSCAGWAHVVRGCAHR